MICTSFSLLSQVGPFILGANTDFQKFCFINSDGTVIILLTLCHIALACMLFLRCCKFISSYTLNPINPSPQHCTSTLSPSHRVLARPPFICPIYALHQLVRPSPAAVYQISLLHVTVALHQLICHSPPSCQLVRPSYIATTTVRQLTLPTPPHSSSDCILSPCCRCTT